MTPNLDPFEEITIRLIKADQADLAIAEGVRAKLDEDIARISGRIDAYALTLQGCHLHRPVIHPNGAPDPFADEMEVAKELDGLTTFGQLIKLGLMDNRRLRVNHAGHLMHRLGTIGGKWKHVPVRLYRIIAENPDVFKKITPGEYEILDGAEIHMPDTPLVVIPYEIDTGRPNRS